MTTFLNFLKNSSGCQFAVAVICTLFSLLYCVFFLPKAPSYLKKKFNLLRLPADLMTSKQFIIKMPVHITKFYKHFFTIQATKLWNALPLKIRKMYQRVLEDFLSKNEVDNIINEIKPGCQLIEYNLQPAAQGLMGLLGDHLRVTLQVKDDNRITNLHLFIKSVPFQNKPKADFINQNYFFKREAVMFKIIEEMGKLDDPWYPKAFIHNERILVMPDLSVEGYKQIPALEYFDKQHVLVCTSTIARFHATFANYATKKSTPDHQYNLLEEYDHIMTEPLFIASASLYAAAKLTKNILQEFSEESDTYPESFEELIYNLFVKGCDSLKPRNDTLNVIIHKDLWANNIMFRYRGNVPTKAILIDYQCMRYGPPAFDLMIFLYLTTATSFRNLYEKEIFTYYYTVFSQNLDEPTKKRLQYLNYNREAFLDMCEQSRLFALVEAITIFPFVLMDPKSAQTTFDDPETFIEYFEVDRTAPVLAHAREHMQYRMRQLEVSQEFVKRYIRY